jgi:hypothetical protein
MKNIIPFKTYEANTRPTKFNKFLNFTDSSVEKIKELLENIPNYKQMIVNGRIVSNNSKVTDQECEFTGYEFEVLRHDFKLGDRIEGRIYKVVNDYGTVIFKLSFKELRPIPQPPVVGFKIFTTKEFDVYWYMNRFGKDWKREIWPLDKVLGYFYYGRDKF